MFWRPGGPCLHIVFWLINRITFAFDWIWDLSSAPASGQNCNHKENIKENRNWTSWATSITRSGVCFLFSMTLTLSNRNSFLMLKGGSYWAYFINFINSLQTFFLIFTFHGKLIFKLKQNWQCRVSRRCKIHWYTTGV